jgi:hypothetical protein
MPPSPFPSWMGQECQLASEVSSLGGTVLLYLATSTMFPLAWGGCLWLTICLGKEDHKRTTAGFRIAQTWKQERSKKSRAVLCMGRKAAGSHNLSSCLSQEHLWLQSVLMQEADVTQLGRPCSTEQRSHSQEQQSLSLNWLLSWPTAMLACWFFFFVHSADVYLVSGVCQVLQVMKRNWGSKWA